MNEQKATAMVLGWLMGRIVAQRRRKMIGWSYNGVFLPPFPVEGWDQERFPYMHLYIDAADGHYTLYAQGKRFQYGTFLLNDVIRKTAFAVYGKKEPVVYQRLKYKDGVWTVWEDMEQVHSGVWYLWTTADPVWANYDILTAVENEMWLPASEPVPVYE